MMYVGAYMWSPSCNIIFAPPNVHLESSKIVSIVKIIQQICNHIAPTMELNICNDYRIFIRGGEGEKV